VFASSSLFTASQIAAFTLMSIIAAQLGGGDSLAGVPATMQLIGRAAVAFPIGWLMGRAGRRVGLTIGFFIGIVGSLLSAFSILWGSFAGFAGGVFLLGAARGVADLGRFAAAEIYPLNRQAKIIGLVVFSGTIGAIVGPLLVTPATALARATGLPDYAGPYLLGALFSAAALLLTFLFMRPDPLRLSRELPDLGYKEAASGSAAPLRVVFKRPSVQLGVASMALGQLVMTMLMVITPLHMAHNDHTTGAISLVIMSHTLGMFGLSSLTGWLVDRSGRLPVIVAGAGLLVISSILAPLSSGIPGLAFALFLLGLGWNFCFVGGSALLAGDMKAAERSRVQGAADTLASVASGVGSLSTGVVFAAGGIAAVSALSIGFILMLAAAVAWAARQRRPVESITEA
jgi:MFS family permease